jgi:hypothetical protein
MPMNCNPEMAKMENFIYILPQLKTPLFFLPALLH